MLIARHLLFLVLSCCLLGGAGLAHGQDAISSAAKTPSPLPPIGRFFEGIETRYPGSAGNLETERRVAERFAASGFAHGEIHFDAPTFLPGKTILTHADMGEVEVLPMHPSLVRPGNFKEDRFEAPLVYLGMGSVSDLESLDGVTLNGAIGVLEFDSGANWKHMLRFGMRGFLFLGQADYDQSEAVSKIYNTEVAVPRFLVPAADADRVRDWVRKPNRTPVQVDATPSRWKNEDLRNLWVFIPGSDTEGLGRNVITVTAPLDANSIVPQLAPGGTSQASLYLLLKMLEEYGQVPPRSSVMLVAVNAHTQRFQGERMLAWNLLEGDDPIQRVRNEMTADIRLAQTYLDYYSKLKVDDPTQVDSETEALLIAMRSLSDDSLGQRLSIKEPIVTLSRRDVNEIKSKRVKVKSLKLTPDEEQQEFDRLTAKYMTHVNVLTLFNKVGVKTTLTDLTTDERIVLRDYVKQIKDENEEFIRLQSQDRERLTANRAIREVLKGRKVRMVFSLDLNWGSDEVGFNGASEYLTNSKFLAQYGVNSVRIAKELSESEGLPPYFLDTMTNFGSQPSEHYFPAPENGSMYFHGVEKTPALSLQNCFARPIAQFTPSDTLSNIPEARLAAHMEYLPQLFRALMDDDVSVRDSELTPPSQTKGAYTVLVRSLKFDEFSASSVPNLPVANTFILLTNGKSLKQFKPLYGGEVLNAAIALTDSRAARYFYEMNYECDTAAYQFDENFRTVQHVIDAGEAEKKSSSHIELEDRSKRLAMFECKEIQLLERHDSASLSGYDPEIQAVTLLDGVRNSEPRKFCSTGIAITGGRSMSGTMGPAAIFVEPEVQVKVITSTKRLAINATEESPEGEGFGSQAEIGTDFFKVATHDMQRLNEYRLSRMSGVSNELALAFRDQGEEAAEAMTTAAAEKRHTAYLQQLYLAFGSQVKAYGQIASMTNDMLKAIVFYMLLLLPFVFFMQKLVFNFVRIEAQMAAFGVLFIATFAVFRFIHPAFRVAQAPEAIFIAFTMLVLGLFVIIILHGRFEGEMKVLFQTYTGMDNSDVGFGAVAQKAMLIGVNNMKRRRTRTALTTATVVLVTFAMLAFSSVSKNMSPTFVPRSKDARYTGILFHRNGNLRMDEGTLRILKELYSRDCDRIVVRRWMIPPVSRSGASFAYSMASEGESGKRSNIGGLLGLGQGDIDFLDPNGLPFLPGSQFFSSDDALEAILPAAAAEAIGLGPDDVGTAYVLFRGARYKLVGILKDVRLRALAELDGRTILPIAAVSTQGMGQSQDDASASMDDDGSDASVTYVPTSSLLILPLETSRRLGAEPYSVSIRLKSDQPVWPAISKMLTATSAKFYVSSTREFKIRETDKTGVSAGVYYVGSGYKTAIGGLARLVIPLLIAATIIMNTMLGTVYERRGEIAVFNAIGLNPRHIMMFFLAESLVYSVIGSVGGYLVGQVLALGLTKMELVGGLNLNFSSLTVVYVILFTIAVVVGATLYPAYEASRSAVPSGQSKWVLPSNDGRTMQIVMPFIYQPPLAPGIVEYLDDYFSRFSEASIGEMIARPEAKTMSGQGTEHPTYELRYNVALAPYDLGVTQTVSFQAAFNKTVNSYQVTLVNTRLSGQDTNWMTTNRPFLEKLRKYMMHWRNLDGASQSMYVERAGTHFGIGADPNAPNTGEANFGLFEDESVPIEIEAHPGKEAEGLQPSNMPLFDAGGGPETEELWKEQHPKNAKSGDSDASGTDNVDDAGKDQPPTDSTPDTTTDKPDAPR